MDLNNIKSLKDALNEFSSQRKVQKPILEARVVNFWRELMGEAVHKYTENIYMVNSTLFIKVGPPPLKNELVYLSEEIKDKINAHIGQVIVSKIVLL
jgi:hypothetical protein